MQKPESQILAPSPGSRGDRRLRVQIAIPKWLPRMDVSTIQGAIVHLGRNCSELLVKLFHAAARALRYPRKLRDDSLAPLMF